MCPKCHAHLGLAHTAGTANEPDRWWHSCTSCGYRSSDIFWGAGSSDGLATGVKDSTKKARRIVRKR